MLDAEYFQQHEHLHEEALAGRGVHRRGLAHVLQTRAKVQAAGSFQDANTRTHSFMVLSWISSTLGMLPSASFW